MDGGRAVVPPHSTDEGGELQGSRKGRPQDPLEGRGCPSGRIGRGNHRRDSDLGSRCPHNSPDYLSWPTEGIPRGVGVVSPIDEPAAGMPHGGVCEGGGLGNAMADLYGHEAGNGGYSQGTPTASQPSPTRRWDGNRLVITTVSTSARIDPATNKPSRNERQVTLQLGSDASLIVDVTTGTPTAGNFAKHSLYRKQQESKLKLAYLGVAAVLGPA